MALWLTAATPAPGPFNLVCEASRAVATTQAYAALAPVFASVKTRIPAYADWLFEWSPSYDRDRVLLSAAFDETWQRARRGDFSNPWPAIQGRLEENIESTFSILVVAPETTDPALARAWSW